MLSRSARAADADESPRFIGNPIEHRFGYGLEETPAVSFPRCDTAVVRIAAERAACRIGPCSFVIAPSFTSIHKPEKSSPARFRKSPARFRQLLATERRLAQTRCTDGIYPRFSPLGGPGRIPCGLHEPSAGLRTRRRFRFPTCRRFPARERASALDGFRSYLPLRGSPGLPPGSLFPRFDDKAYRQLTYSI